MELFEWIFENVTEFLSNILPLSPFAGPIAELQKLPYLGFLNWIIPVGDLLEIFGAWLGVLLLFYGYSFLLRWAKVISG